MSESSASDQHTLAGIGVCEKHVDDDAEDDDEEIWERASRQCCVQLNICGDMLIYSANEDGFCWWCLVVVVDEDDGDGDDT